MQLAFHTLDVFTDTRFGGNPLAVVLGADDLTQNQMQAVAREFNLSETVFVLKPFNPAHSARVRIFTPAVELPFAGHPTVGTAILLAELKSSGDDDGDANAIVVLEEQIGVVRVGVRFRKGRAPFAEFDVPKLPEDIGGAASGERIAAALGLIPSEIGFANHRPTRFSAGVPYTFVPIASLDAMAKARVNPASWQAAFGEQTAAYLYTSATTHASAHLHARMFMPGGGIAEDPATGSAAAALAGVVHRFDQPPEGSHRRMIEQGFEMGRPSHISLTLEVRATKLAGVRIGGHAVRVTEGTVRV
ncbi:MAG: PhzF family phenazine biosynthesis protein [Hyphomicrobiaceae bacterium]